MIEWFAKNHVAANLLMLTIVVSGIFAINNKIALELMPDFKLSTVTITTFLPGANPKSIEETVTARVEESITDIEGIKKITSRTAENISTVIVELQSDYPELDLLSDIKVRVDSLNTLPADAERPVIQLAEAPIQVIGIAIYGDSSYDDLFRATEDIRNALLQVDGITNVGNVQAPSREIHIEVSPNTLKQYNLSLADVGRAIERNSLDVSAGNLRTLNGDILVRTNGQAYNKHEFETIPVLNSGDSVIYLKDIARVVDGYELARVETQYNGQPAITFDIYRVGKQSTIEIADLVNQFIVDYQHKLPKGLKIGTYGNTAEMVEDRLSTLITSALQGGVLVLILLSLFLRPAIAFWVGIGIPVCFLGCFAVMPMLGLTLNMLTMFAFLLVLGIVVDDAIVTGENIYRHMRMGVTPDKAALIGTKEVATPVTFGVITTMAAFAPLLFVEGSLSNFAAQIPLVVIPVLVFSLIESKLILPSHMSTIKPRSDDDLSTISRIQQNFSRGFENAIIKVYRPFLNLCVKNQGITIVTAFMIFIITIASLATGWLQTSFFPKFEDNAIYVKLTMPTSSSYDNTKKEIGRILYISEDLSHQYVDPETNQSHFRYYVSVVGLTFGNTGLTFGNHHGLVIIEFDPKSASADKSFSVSAVQEELRKRIGDIPGVERLSLSSNFNDFGKPISVSLYGEDSNKLKVIADQVRDYLRSYPGIFDIQDNYSNGKDELQMTIKPIAKALGLRQSDIAFQVRQAVYGYEAQRIQRNSNEIKVMVRYPKEFRSSLVDIYQVPIRKTNTRYTIPLSQLVELTPTTSPTAIYRDKHSRTLTVNADIDSDSYDVNVIRSDLRKFLDNTVGYEPGITYNMDGQAETQKETNESFLLGFMIVMIIIYALLAVPFKSFGQPFVVMSIIPLAIVGAIVGHYVMGLSFSMLSIMGILGLTGVVVNDSLVLVDYINQQRAKGMDLLEAVLSAGETRFRPVMLTSMTTFVGLLPLMISKSVQTQALVPMSVSLGFGILFATIITLIITPVNYLLGRRLKYKIKGWFGSN